MDLRRLEVFAEVAELGSFSRAAEARLLTRPTVCKHARDLEQVARAFDLVTHRERTRSPRAAALVGFVESRVAAPAS